MKAAGSPDRCRVLVMDDEYCIRDTTQKLLQQMGYRADSAGDSDSAIAMYVRAKRQNQPYGMVILDLTITSGRGAVETLEELRQVDPEVKAIVTSGYHHSRVMANPVAFGFCAKLAKPYDRLGLARAVGLAGVEPRAPSGPITAS